VARDGGHEAQNVRDVVPIFEATFDSEDQGLCFDAKSDKSRLIIPWDAAKAPELPTALHDLTSHVRYPRRTFEYCRMALETVRRHFDPPTVQGHRERGVEGEGAMCEALRTGRKSLQALDCGRREESSWRTRILD
jgi:hypothetical protein